MKNFLILFSIVALIAAGMFFYLLKEERARRITSEQNVVAKIKEYDDTYGRYVYEAMELRLSVKQFKQIVKQDSIFMNDFERKLAHANDIIKSQNKKIKHVESVNSILLQSSGSNTIIYQLNDTCGLKSINPVHTPFFDATFGIVNDSIIVMKHFYHTGIDVIIDRDRALDEDGTKRFIFCRWISPRWVYSSSVVAEDTSARIKSNVLIRFEK